jgi:GNAT superfamily N-acetyltransferase
MKQSAAPATDSTVQVRPVTNRDEFQAFFEFPWRVYADDPNWIPPLLSMRRELLDHDENPAWQYMDGQYFAAWRGDEIVGTIAAYVNHRFNDYWDTHIGWFGAFDVLNDADAAQALLDTATEWVQERGYEAIRGPQTFTPHEECGLLVEGYDPPVLMMPYHRPYYQAFIEANGFEKVMDIHSLYIDRDRVQQANTVERLARIVERSKTRSNITIRPLNMKNKDEEFRIFRDIYNEAWDKNWGFVPMNDAELDALIESLGMFVEPGMSFFAEIDGEPVGFAMTLPDFNELLQRVYPKPGVPEWWSLIQLGWHWKIARSIKGLRLPLMGVKADYRNKGVDLALIYETLMALLPSRYTHLDCGWVLETNQLMGMTEKMGGEKYRTHRFYEKRF